MRALDLTFDDGWMYVFELIQNALDAGASSMSFRIEGDDRLAFQHDGNAPIEERDVEGLSKAFRSTKSASKVGFMGIGFKSVFRRFSSVSVSGWGWKFRFDVPRTIGAAFQDVQRDMLGSVLPVWDEAFASPTDDFTTMFTMQGLLRDGTSIESDLSQVTRGEDKPLLAILARAGLRRLDLDGQQWDLGIHQEADRVFEATALSAEEDRLWQVFSVEFTPSRKAVARFLEHRKIQPEPREEDEVYGAASRPRSVIGIMPLDDKGIPTPPRRGQVHALLPTGTNFPLGLHISADWLLNISRKEIKGIGDDEWQLETAAATADLFAAYVLWIAGLTQPTAITAAFSALRVPGQEGVLATALSNSGWRTRLRNQLHREAIFPAWDESGNLSFCTASEVLVPPPPLAKALDSEPRLKPASLLGGPVLAESVFGQGARHLLGEGVLGEMSVRDVHDAWTGGLEAWWLGLDGDVTKRDLLVRLWAAVSECGEGNEALPCIRTESGQWVDASSLSYLNESLPSDEVPGAAEVRTFLLSHRPQSEQLLPVQWRQSLWASSGPESTKVRDWLSENAQAISHKVLIEDAIQSLSEQEMPDWLVLVPLGNWVRRLERSDLLTHVLVEDGDCRVGRLTTEALLAEPYVVDGAVRRHLSRRSAVVSADYISFDGEASDWASFFGDAGTIGSVQVWETSRDAGHSDAESFLGVQVGSSTAGYKLVDFDLFWNEEQRVLPSLVMPEDASALASWLERDAIELRGYGRRRVEYYYYTSKTAHGETLSTWASALSEWSWVPCDDGVFRRPGAVLPAEDEVRDDAPVASLSQELIEVLQDEGIEFGTAIPEASSLRKLLKVGNQVGPSELALLLEEVLSDARADDQGHLEEAVRSLRLPVGDGRIPIDRVVRRAGGRSRGLLGGYLTALSGIDASLRRQLEREDFPHSFPETTTGGQSLAFLRGVWQRALESPAGLADEVRGVLPAAFAYVREDMLDAPDLRSHWERATSNAMVFADGQWVALRGEAEVFFDDIADRRFVPVGVSVHVATSGHLGESPEARAETADALALPRLSSVCQLEWSTSGKSAAPGMTRSVAEVWSLLLAVQGSGADVAMPSPLVDAVDALRLTLRMNGHSEEVAVHARLTEDHCLVLAGHPLEFAADAAKEILRAFGFGQRADLATDLTAMLSAIERPDAFGLAIRKFRRSYLPEDALQDTDGGRQNSAASGDFGGKTGESDSRGAGDNDTPGLPSQPSTGRSEREGGSTGQESDGETEAGASGGDPSYTSERAKAPQRAVAEQLRSMLKGELIPGPEEAPGNGETQATDGASQESASQSLGDEEYRRVACQYERDCGRTPEEGDPMQVGWDIRSLDEVTKEERLIEVKGRGRPWDSTEVVELSRAQVRKAFEAKASSASTWWLYVVERVDGERFQVLPIPNPTTVASKWLLEGGAWRLVAEEPRELYPVD